MYQYTEECKKYLIEFESMKLILSTLPSLKWHIKYSNTHISSQIFTHKDNLQQTEKEEKEVDVFYNKTTESS